MERNDATAMTEEERAARRARRDKARRERFRARRRRQMLLLAPFLAAGVIAAVLLSGMGHRESEAGKDVDDVPAVGNAVVQQPKEPQEPRFVPAATAAMAVLGEEIPSSHAVLIDAESGEILAEKDADAVISPASMTKILTLLVAVEQLESEEALDDTVTITREITDYCYVNDCSVVGLEVDEVVPVRELLYGTILSSGADAALALACYTAGSHEAFVALMNEKLAALGLDETAHFTNCVGLYDEDHHCTVTDMAVILKAAMDDPLCRQVLSAHSYETRPTEEHPEGQILSNWFLRKIEDHDADNAVRAVAAKTGYVMQSGNCAASYGEDAQGHGYLCVTANAYSSWRAIYDHVELYKMYCS